MNPFRIIFWALGAVVVLFIGWSFVRMPLEELKERRLRRGRAKTSHSAAGGTQSANDTATSIGSDFGDSGGGDWSA